MARTSLSIAFTDPAQVNKAWKVFNQQSVITIPNNGLTLHRNSRIFTIGSCFALEIRKAFRALQYDVYPKYTDMQLDQQQIVIANIGKPSDQPSLYDSISHYHTYSIKQELERYLGHWHPDKNDYWEVQNDFWGAQPVYQDPYRRAIFGRTPEALRQANAAIDRCIADGIRSADIYVITLGLIEIWKQKSNGRAVCANPGYNAGGGMEETEFYLSTFEDNYRNIKDITAMLRQINPAAKIVFSVSPVPLGSTFTRNDVVVANTESKTLLRAALGQVLREESDIVYYPSYEICSSLTDVFLPDGRHVRPEIVQTIVQSFIKGFSTRQPPAGDAELQQKQA